MASSQYLSSKAEALASTKPVPPAQAQAAQIPLQSFELPAFPPEAFTAGLGALILTSDIKLDEYTDLLTKPFSIPELPTSIKSLTLELFSLGYPPGFLTALGLRFVTRPPFSSSAFASCPPRHKTRPTSVSLKTKDSKSLNVPKQLAEEEVLSSKSLYLDNKILHSP